MSEDEFNGLVEKGTGVPCFMKISKIPSLKVLPVKNVKLNVQNTFEVI